MSATVSEQLPLLAAAPNGIRKLRALILELAVRGKLVAQDPSEEPASELLKRIAAEKKRLVVEGEIKSPKSLSEIAEEEKPFELPVGWDWTRLAEIAFSQAGFAFRSNGFNAAGIGLPLIRIRDVGQSFSGTFYEGEYRPEFLVESGDYLISMDGEFRVAVWKGEPALLNQRVSRLIFFGKETARRFIADSLQARLRERQGIKAYTTVDHLSGGQISESIIGLPPLSEQHRIVAKVDELMVLCDRLEAQQADAESAHEQLVATLLGSLTQASDADDFAASWQRLSGHFHTLFTTESSIDALKQTLLQLAVMGKLVPQEMANTGNSELPTGWCELRIEEFCTVQGGIQKTPLRRPVSLHFPYLRVANVQRGHIDVSELARYELSLDELEKWRLNAGDLLIVEGNGSGSEIGRCAIWQGEVVDCVYQNHLIRVRPELQEQVDYLALYLNSPLGMAHMRRLAITTSGLFNLSVGKIRSIPVALPPLAEQHRIVAKVDQLMALCDQLSAVIQRRNQHSRQLADALVDKALSSSPKTSMNVVDLSCYLVDRLAAKPAFGRTAHMKSIYLADIHLGFDFRGNYVREAAGPLDTNIYQVEKQAETNGWYTHTTTLLKSGKEKVTYHATDALAAKAQEVAEALGDKRKELDRLIALLGDRKTEELEIVATLFAAWNDALLDGQFPSDDWIIREVRENWHIKKQRFTAEKLGHWLDWMRKHQLVPIGKPPRTLQQVKMFQ